MPNFSTDQSVSTIACTKTFLIKYSILTCDYSAILTRDFSELKHVTHFIGTQQYVNLGFDYLWVGRCVDVIVSFKNVQLPWLKCSIIYFPWNKVIIFIFIHCSLFWIFKSYLNGSSALYSWWCFACTKTFLPSNFVKFLGRINKYESHQ